MALKLTLKPGEKIAINGAVIVNGERRANLTLENEARVLRERDILQPEEATTPAKRIYLAIMLLYLDPSDRERLHSEYAQRLLEFVEAISTPEALETCAKLAAHMANNAYYKALLACRDLIEFEETRLAHVA